MSASPRRQWRVLVAAAIVMAALASAITPRSPLSPLILLALTAIPGVAGKLLAALP